MRKKIHQWLKDYVEIQRATLAGLDLDAIIRIIETLRQARHQGRHVYVIGNGGNAANASHFAVDLGKGASDAGVRRFRVFSLNDNVPWLTALGNDYGYEDVFVRQIINFGQPGDVLIASSVSGNSPNLIKAMEWAKANQITTIALVGAKQGKLAEIADQALVIGDAHYGRVEDVQMTIFHLLCYGFSEFPALEEAEPVLAP